MFRPACLPVLFSLVWLAAPPERPPVWLSDLAPAQRQARAEGKPIFVVFRCEH